MAPIMPPYAKGAQGVDHNEVRISVAVPSTYGQSKRVTDEVHQRRAREVMKQLSDWFGGYTTISASGGWVTGDGKLVREPVKIVQTYAKREAYNEHRSNFARYVRGLAERWKQDAIAVEFEDDLYFVKPPAKR